jgi:hypothetical protein
MARRTVSEFLAEFVVPLVRGGELVVGVPIDADDLRLFEDDLPHASEALVAVDEARTDVLAELVVRPPSLVLDVDELRLAAAVHNMLFLAHPRADSWAVSRGRARKVAETAEAFASQPLSQDRSRVLARHALLHNLFDLTRRDTEVSWWTGSARFLGQKPPTRLTRWSSVRRVRTRVDVAGYHELLATPEASPIVGTLLRRSPLTLVLGAPDEAPPIKWEDAVFLLRDAELARAIAYAALAPTEPDELIAAPARYAAGFEQMLERNPADADVRAVAALLVHLGALLAMAETRQRDLDAPSPLLTGVLAPERAGQRKRGLSTFFAVPNALARVDPRLAEPPGLRDEPRLARRWDCHRAQVESGVGEAVIETLASRIARHLGGALQLTAGEQASPERVEVSDNPS